MKHFEGELLSRIGESGTIRDLAEKAGEILGNPLLIADASYRILYSSSYFNEKGIELWDKAAAERYISWQMIEEMKRTDVMNAIENGNYVVTEMSNGYHAARMPLMLNEHYCGFIGTYDYEKPFEADLQENLSVLAKLIRIFMNFDSTFVLRDLNRREAFLHQLILAEKDEISAVLSRYETLKNATEKQMYVFENTDGRNLNDLKDELSMCPLQLVSIISQGKLVCLLYYQLEYEAQRKASESFLRDFINRNRLRHAVSISFTDDDFIPSVSEPDTAAYPADAQHTTTDYSYLR